MVKCNDLERLTLSINVSLSTSCSSPKFALTNIYISCIINICNEFKSSKGLTSDFAFIINKWRVLYMEKALAVISYLGDLYINIIYYRFNM